MELACVNAGAEGRYGVDDGVGERGTDCARHGVAKRRQLGLRHPSQSCQGLLWREGGVEDDREAFLRDVIDARIRRVGVSPIITKYLKASGSVNLEMILLWRRNVILLPQGVGLNHYLWLPSCYTVTVDFISMRFPLRNV